MKKRPAKYIGLVIAVLVLAGFTTSYLRTRISADIQFAGQSGIKVLVNDMVNLPIEGAQVVITAQTGREQAITSTDSTGYYSTPARPGDYTLLASAPGYISETKTVELSQNEHEEVVFFLSPEL